MTYNRALSYGFFRFMIFARIFGTCLCLFFLSIVIPGTWNSAGALITHLRGGTPKNVIMLPDGWLKSATAFPEESRPRGGMTKRTIYCGIYNGESIAVLGPAEDPASIRIAARAAQFDHSYSQRSGVLSKAYLGGASVPEVHLTNLVGCILMTLLSIFVLVALYTSELPSRKKSGYSLPGER